MLNSVPNDYSSYFFWVDSFLRCYFFLSFFGKSHTEHESACMPQTTILNDSIAYQQMFVRVLMGAFVYNLLTDCLGLNRLNQEK